MGVLIFVNRQVRLLTISSASVFHCAFATEIAFKRRGCVRTFHVQSVLGKEPSFSQSIRYYRYLKLLATRCLLSGIK